MLDLSNFTSDKANIPIAVVIKHPVTGADTDVVIKVVGTDSAAAQACADGQQARRFAEMTDKQDTAALFDPKTNRANMIELLVACTTGWENMGWEGSDLPFSPENAAMIYEKVPAIRDQVSKATGSRKLFFKD